MVMILQLAFAVLCFALISVIMVQHRKKGGFSGSFGSGTQMDMANGSWQRMNSLTKLTVVLTAAFMLCSLALVFFGGRA